MTSIPPIDKDPREIWDERYEGVREQGGSTLHYDPWLERWRYLMAPGSRVLDLGCGSGHDTLWLNKAGYRVNPGDFSFSALRIVQAGLPSPDLLQLDLRQGLPFAPGAFDAIVANLCLHYFPWPQTVEILGRVHRCLKPGGTLLARFNSTRDSNFGAEGCPPVERNAFWVKGMYKRYFDREDLASLFSQGWQVHGFEEFTIHRYQLPKVLWEVVAAKS